MKLEIMGQKSEKGKRKERSTCYVVMDASSVLDKKKKMTLKGIKQYVFLSCSCYFVNVRRIRKYNLSQDLMSHEM